MNLIWTDTARDRLAEIEDYIARDNPVAAIDLTDALIERAEIIAEHPDIGSHLPELPNSAYRQLAHGRYRIVYDTAGDTVRIRTVFPGERQLPTEDLA